MIHFGSFRWLMGDVNFTAYGGKWVRHVCARRYHVIELINWCDAVGKREAAEMGTYHVSLSEIDLDAIDPTSALESCGMARTAGGMIETAQGDIVAEGADVDLVIVDACHGYGAKGPISGESGNNYRKLIRDAIRTSRSLDDPEAHEKAMRKRVNRIGSTAAEYMRGDITSGILRGVAAGDPRAELMLKLGVK